MKKIFTFVAILASAMVVFSCKNGGNKAAEEAEGAVEQAVEAAGSAIDYDSLESIMEAPVEQAAQEAVETVKDSAAVAAEAAIEKVEGSEALAAGAQNAAEAIQKAAGDAPVEEAVVTVKPTFNGGDANSFMKYVHENIVYPEAATANNESGKVIVSFVVDATGKVGNVKVLKSVSEALDAEAVRVVSGSPDWTPGQNADGVAVPVCYRLPVTFALR